MASVRDEEHMRTALALAAEGLGHTWPNPSVGALLVKDRAVVGFGATARGGRPHAEMIALGRAGKKARGATLYVTLEPCAHHGRTRPCADAVVQAGVERVVAATGDPYAHVAGKGFERLKAAGVEVVVGVCEKEARRLNEGFFSVVERGRPFVALKLATSADAKIAGGKSRWITGETARLRGHELRATHDAILTGIGTVLADDPRLTCRLPGREEDSPQRIVLDSHLRLPPDAKCLPAWIFTTEAALADPKAQALSARGGSTLFTAPAEQGRLLLPDVLAQLARRGITRLLVEAGAALSTSFLREGLADRVYWFRAAKEIGPAGLAAFEGSPDLPDLYRASVQEAVGDDRLDIYERGAV